MIAEFNEGVSHVRTVEPSGSQLRNDYADVPMNEGLAEIDAAVALLRKAAQSVEPGDEGATGCTECRD